MVQESLLGAIQYFQEVNSRAGDVDTKALGDEAATNMAGDMDERFTTLQIALVVQLQDLVQKANDNVVLGLEINRLMWFYGMGMCPDKEFWREQFNIHGSIRRIGLDTATMGINLSNRRYDMEVDELNADVTPAKAVWVRALKNSVDKLNIEKSRLGQLTAIYNEIDRNIEERQPIFSESERPDVAGIDLKSAFLAIHHELGAKSAEDLAKANLKVAQTLLVRRSFIEQRAIPNHSPEGAVKLRHNVYKMRDSIAGALERAKFWLDVQAVSEKYAFPDSPNPS